MTALQINERDQAFIRDDEGAYIIAHHHWDDISLFFNTTFTRSDGTLFSRIYERLTKASRRTKRGAKGGWNHQAQQRAYRAGVKDTLEALRTELS